MNSKAEQLSEDQIALTMENWDHVVQTSASLSRRNKRMIRILAVSLALDIVLTVALAIVANVAYTGSNQANQAITTLHSSAVATCEANNESRSMNRTLWLHSLKPLIPAHPTAAQVRIIQAEIVLINKTFEHRDCDAVNPLP